MQTLSSSRHMIQGGSAAVSLFHYRRDTALSWVSTSYIPCATPGHSQCRTRARGARLVEIVPGITESIFIGPGNQPVPLI